MLQEAKLNAFSQKAADDIQSNFPNLINFMQVKSLGNGDNTLVISVQSPVCADTLPFWIKTYNNEFTIGFDYAHRHHSIFFPLDNTYIDPITSFSGTAGGLITEIFKENICSVSWWLDDKWVSSAFCPKSETFESNFPFDYSRIRVRSWLGTFTQNISND